VPTRTTELKYLHRVLEANAENFLAASGMEFFHDRFFYKYEEDRILFAEIDVSGGLRGELWKSLACTLHIYYKDFPGFGKPPLHETGRAIPTYRQSRLRFVQERALDQSAIVERLENSTLKFDNTLWHVLDDESNVAEVLGDMARAIQRTGIPTAMKDTYSRAAMLAREKSTREGQ
jgi:hypothetical protein